MLSFIDIFYEENRYLIIFIKFWIGHPEAPPKLSESLNMRAIVIKEYGGPDVLSIEERPDPKPQAGHVLIEVKAFGVNHAETHMREGQWPEATEISGIECAGLVRADPSGRLAAGQKVVAFMGGMGRSINGSYAELTSVPASNVLPIKTELPWETLAAIPESYATAWAALFGNLDLRAGQTIVIRGATSALGQAAVNIAARAGARVVASTRNPKRAGTLEALGAKDVALEGPELSKQIRDRYPQGADAVFELVGNSTVIDSLTMVRRHGRLCLAGFLGGLGPIPNFMPVMQMPSGVHFSFFGSFMFGAPDFPTAEIPMQTIVERVEDGAYKAKPARVFRFEDIREAHRLMESSEANGKIVVRV
jgi:NADPH2:quinone reductase